MKRQFSARMRQSNSGSRQSDKETPPFYTSKPLFGTADFLIDLFLPNRCPCCDKFIPWNSMVCEDCSEKLDELTICNTSENDTEIFSAFIYDGTAVEAVYAAKFRGDRNFPKLCACYLADYIIGADVCFNAVVPVPMGKKRRRLRGYNQAEVFARFISRFSGLPVLTNTLIRVSETEQHMLSPDERIKNAALSYRPGNNINAVQGKHILLADDVCTTGATITACRELLLRAGAETVTAVTEAMTQIYSIYGRN
jgi:ComF family protein